MRKKLLFTLTFGLIIAIGPILFTAYSALNNGLELGAPKELIFVFFTLFLPYAFAGLLSPLGIFWVVASAGIAYWAVFVREKSK